MKSPRLVKPALIRVMIGVCMTAMVGGCAPSTTVIGELPVAAQAPATEPVVLEPLERVILGSFKTTACDDLTSVDQLPTEPECGWLSTPMFGSNSDVEIKLPVLIFRATGDDPAPDPIIYLHGGPGGGIVEAAWTQYDMIVAPFVAERDVVLFDQRGSGISEPWLNCEPAQNFWSEPGQDDDVEFIARRAKTCAWRVRNHGVVLAEFNKERSAADVMVLARELGYDSVNLIGTSWGGLLATTVMTEHPDLVRSALLNSPLSYKTDLTGSMPASYLEAIGALQAACDEDEVCADRHGDIAGRFAAVVESLDDDPLDLSLIGAPWRRGTYERADYEYVVELTGEQLVHLVFGLLYSPEAIASIPDLLLDLEHRDPRLATRMASVYGWGWGFDFGFLTYMCTDVVSASSLDAVARQQTGERVFDRIDDVPDGRGHTAEGLCEAMNMTLPAPADASEAPSAPTLVFSGRLDPITAFSSGVELAEAIPQGRFVGFDDLSHGALQDLCASQIAVDFFAAPDAALSTDCANDRSPFAIADAALWSRQADQLHEAVPADVFIGEEAISILVPAGYERYWTDAGSVWWREDAPYDMTAFGVFSTSEDWTAQEEIESWFESMGAFDIADESRFSSGGNEWTRHDALSPFGVSLVSIVRADGEIAMMLQTYPEELAELESLFELSAGGLGV